MKKNESSVEGFKNARNLEVNTKKEAKFRSKVEKEAK